MSKPTWLVAAGVLLAVAVAGVIVTIVLAGRDTATAPNELVKIELRARPLAEIKFRGRNLGRTPLTINIPKSTVPEVVDATFEITKYELKTGDKITVRKVQVKTFVPDAPQAIDFDVKDAQ